MAHSLHELGTRHAMKIGLIGNMNNNNFALLRYLVDLGVDAELLLMLDDGVGSLSHFSPENDTWDFTRWQPYIKEVSAPNRFVSAIGNKFPWSVLFWAKFSLAKMKQTPDCRLLRPPSLLQIEMELKPYDRLVGSGVAPALLRAISRRLDVFYPYSSGVEWVGDPDIVAVLDGGGWLKRYGAQCVRDSQIGGIRSAKQVVSCDVGYTSRIFDEMGVSPKPLHLPLLYKESAPRVLPRALKDVLDKLDQFDLKLISHARHRWVNTGDFDAETWELKYSKHNNWIISAYADFVRMFPETKSALVLSEYGTDVEASKKLCRDHGLINNVLWIPAMPRMCLLEIISKCDIGLGEFYSVPKMIYGGTALEIMACGKPLIQGFIFEQGEYEKIYANPEPPICAVRSQDDVKRWLLELGRNTLLRNRLGAEGLEWFDRYNGRGLAKRWLELIAE